MIRGLIDKPLGARKSHVMKRKKEDCSEETLSTWLPGAGIDFIALNNNKNT